MWESQEMKSLIIISICALWFDVWIVSFNYLELSFDIFIILVWREDLNLQIRTDYSYN